MAKRHDPSDEFEVIFVKSYFHRGLGRRVYAYQYGKSVFALKIRKKDSSA